MCLNNQSKARRNWFELFRKIVRIHILSMFFAFLFYVIDIGKKLLTRIWQYSHGISCMVTFWLFLYICTDPSYLWGYSFFEIRMSFDENMNSRKHARSYFTLKSKESHWVFTLNLFSWKLSTFSPRNVITLMHPDVLFLFFRFRFFISVIWVL